MIPRYDVLTLHPEMVRPVVTGSILGRAVEAGLVAIGVHDIRDHATGKHKQADDTPVLLVPAEQENGPAYRVGFKNFEVITRYNRSVRYAMAVHDLAQTIAQRATAATPPATRHLASQTGAEELAAR